MFQKFHRKLKEHEEGFTLIELLVVILIIAILAAIAIPVFLRQREKGYVADVQSTLKNAATAVESYATTTTPPGNYDALGDGAAAWTELQAEEDAKAATGQTVTIATTGSASFCITVVEPRLGAATGDHDWQTATYFSNDGAPSPDDACA